MSKFFQFVTWPVIAGLLLAYIVLDRMDNGLIRGDSPSSSPRQASFSTAVDRAAPAVVNIYTSKRVVQNHPWYQDPILRRFLGRNALREERVLRSLGSGVIMNAGGYILTNYHVIAGADEILVLLHDGRDALATLVGSDPETDLAVLKIDTDALAVIELGMPKTARVGDIVLAIGNPYGFGHSVSQGIISATGRYVGLSTYENFIQTDAAINRGNSGGALVDANGHLLGINTAIFTERNSALGIALATPSDLAVAIMDDIINFGEVIRGWVGLEVNTVLSPRATAGGLRVSTTHLDGPADRAGLRQGDIITHINGSEVTDGRSTMNQIAMMRPGEKISIDVTRAGTALSFMLELGTRPKSSALNP
jgi:serine protease DegS